MNKLEKFIIIILLVVLITINAFIIIIVNMMVKNKNNTNNELINSTNNIIKQNKKELIIDSYTGEYEVYQNDKKIKSFMNFNEAVEYAQKYENASVKRYSSSGWLWDNTPQFNVYLEDNNIYTAFSEFSQAVKYAKENKYADIFYRKSASFIWNNHEPIKKSHIIENVPVIMQYPELYRGCEVTSLAMILKYKGIDADKMKLAQEIRKDNTPYRNENGQIYYGNPNSGFVGNIYDSNERGLGVYHKPITDLLSEYTDNKAVDLTGCNFEDLKYFINKNIPIWIIINSKFVPLPESSFQYWNTPEGKVKVTFSEHSVVITGYDENYIYINDPMKQQSNIRKEKSSFIKAWEQMGKQAVTYCQ